MKLIIAAFITCLSLSAFADNCEDAVSNYDLKICESKRLDVEDKRLNDLYAKLMKKNDQTGQQKLKAAQRAWIAYRDAECDYASDIMRGGTGEGLVALGCLATETKRRADELQDYVDFQ